MAHVGSSNLPRPMKCRLSLFCSSRRRHTILQGDWSSDVCSSDLEDLIHPLVARHGVHVAAIAASVVGVLDGVVELEIVGIVGIAQFVGPGPGGHEHETDRKSTRLN